jgi:hypothetical protein
MVADCWIIIARTASQVKTNEIDLLIERHSRKRKFQSVVNQPFTFYDDRNYSLAHEVNSNMFLTNYGITRQTFQEMLDILAPLMRTYNRKASVHQKQLVLKSRPGHAYKMDEPNRFLAWFDRMKCRIGTTNALAMATNNCATSMKEDAVYFPMLNERAFADVIKWPERAQLSQYFQAYTTKPGGIGSIDGTFIPLKKISDARMHAVHYNHRHHSCGTNNMLIMDWNGLIIEMKTGICWN